MNGDNAIQNTLLEIIQIGLLRIRAFGSEGLAEACSIEADHIHNLPELIKSNRREQLLYYYNVERPAFLRKAVSPPEQFNLHWDRLGNLIAGMVKD